MTRRIPWLALVPLVLFAGLAAMFAIGLERDNPNALPSTREGNPAPETVVGQLGDLPKIEDAALRAPGLKLVNFWASWCGPCRVEHPTLQQLADEGLPVYGINFKDNEGPALEFLDELGNPFTAAGYDPRGEVAVDWGVVAPPESFLIDGTGKIILHFRGPLVQRRLADTLRPAMESAAR